jgi:hypothetical protein
MTESATPTLGKISEKKIGTRSNCNASKPITRETTVFNPLLSPKICILDKTPKTIAKIRRNGKT